MFKETFASLQHVNPEVLYPIPDFSGFEKPTNEPLDDIVPDAASIVFLSINRYERKKNLGLAIEALGMMHLWWFFQFAVGHGYYQDGNCF